MTAYIPQPARIYRQTFLDANRGRILDLWSWNSCYWPNRAWNHQSWTLNVKSSGSVQRKRQRLPALKCSAKLLDEGRAGDNARLLYFAVSKKEEVERGQVLAVPGSITPHKKFMCQAYILTKEEGGRHTPFFNGYRPQFYFRTTDVTGVVTLKAGTEMVMPGDRVEMEVELIAPIAMEKELRFAIREGGRTVGAGRRHRGYRIVLISGERR